MNNQKRMQEIKKRLTNALNPTEIIVTDDSHKHIGHPGAKDGRGHFSVEVVANAFKGKNTVACHRLIYQALGNLMETDVHALSITVKIPE